MSIDHTDIGTDEDLAREVLLVGRTIAPCLSTLPDDSDLALDATAVLRRVYQTVNDRGSHLVKSQRLGGAWVEYESVQDAFEGQATRALKAICVEANKGRQATVGHSVGKFPKRRVVSRLWAED